MSQWVGVETLDIEPLTTAFNLALLPRALGPRGNVIVFQFSPVTAREKEGENANPTMCRNFCRKQEIFPSRILSSICYATFFHLLLQSNKTTSPSFWNSPLSSFFNSATYRKMSAIEITHDAAEQWDWPLQHNDGVVKVGTPQFRAKIKRFSGSQHQGALRGRSGRLVLHSQGNRGIPLNSCWCQVLIPQKILRSRSQARSCSSTADTSSAMTSTAPWLGNSKIDREIFDWIYFPARSTEPTDFQMTLTSPPSSRISMPEVSLWSPLERRPKSSTFSILIFRQTYLSSRMMCFVNLSNVHLTVTCASYHTLPSLCALYIVHAYYLFLS